MAMVPLPEYEHIFSGVIPKYLSREGDTFSRSPLPCVAIPRGESYISDLMSDIARFLRKYTKSALSRVNLRSPNTFGTTSCRYV